MFAIKAFYISHAKVIAPNKLVAYIEADNAKAAMARLRADDKWAWDTRYVRVLGLEHFTYEPEVGYARKLEMWSLTPDELTKFLSALPHGPWNYEELIARLQKA